jgi:phosphoglycerate kinase
MLTAAALSSSGRLGADHDTVSPVTRPQAVLDERQLAALRAVKWPSDAPSSAGMREMLSAIPPLEAMSTLPAGTPVLLRGDLDVPVADDEVVDDVRLRSMLPTLQFGLEHGWRWIVIGHIGRKPNLSLAPVARRLEQLCETPAAFVPEWLDESGASVTRDAEQALAGQPHGSLLVLENTRRYDVERALWSVTPESFDSVATGLLATAHTVRSSLSSYLVNEGLSASNLDFSSCVLPLIMRRATLGHYTHEELSVAINELSSVDCVVFSGVKANKLDDLEDIVSSRKLRLIVVGGALAMALHKAQAELDGGTFTYGSPEYDSTDVAHMPAERVIQSRRILEQCRAQHIEILLPVDYRLDDGTVAQSIPDDRKQLDIGPQTLANFETALRDRAADGSVRTAYLNGSVGVFEDPHFSAGTHGMVKAFCGLTSSGVKTFVGGGEARAALLQFASEHDVTHAFTAGGTILKVMKSSPIGYVASNYYASLSAHPE